MKFDEPGIFYVPDIYKRERVAPTERAPRIPPPIPETGWVPRADYPDLSAAKALAFDTETFDPTLSTQGIGSRRGGYIVGFSVAVEGWSRYYPIAHSIGPNLDKEPAMRWLKDQLERERQLKVVANGMYDCDYLWYEGIKVKGPFWDVLWADPLINEYEWSYSLDAVAQRRLNKRKETSVLYKWCAAAYGGPEDDTQRANIWRSPSTLVGPYAEVDASLPLEIMPVQKARLEAMAQDEICDMEMRLLPLLLQMRLRGVRIDLKRCEEVDAELTLGIDKLQNHLKVNVYAAEELAKLCDAESIQYPKTALGNPSFVKDWLLAHPHPKLQQVAELRTLHKMRDTFIRGHLMGSHINGRVHCELHPLRADEYGTVSGRFSCSNPNLQQIPARHPYWARIIRSCFIPEEGEVWGKDDLSQIEFRLGVHYGKGNVEPIREQYRNDPKTSFYKLAASMTGLDYTPAKSLSLGSLYGMGLDKFALTTGRTVEEAKPIFFEFHRKLSFMKSTYYHYSKYAEETRTAYEDGWVRTIGGRLCHLQEGLEHKALNRLLQGSCADWIKRAMLDAYEGGVLDVLTLLLTVHDELDQSIPRTQAGAEAARELHSMMANAYVLNIPVYASVGVGRSWGQLQELVSPEALDLAALEAA